MKVINVINRRVKGKVLAKLIANTVNMWDMTDALDMEPVYIMAMYRARKYYKGYIEPVYRLGRRNSGYWDHLLHCGMKENLSDW